jgi:hypothetical protein
MKIREALNILKRPVFGNERHIQARDLIHLARKARTLRRAASRAKLILPANQFPPIAGMTAEEIEREFLAIAHLAEAKRAAN